MCLHEATLGNVVRLLLYLWGTTHWSSKSCKCARFSQKADFHLSRLMLCVCAAANVWLTRQFVINNTDKHLSKSVSELQSVQVTDADRPSSSEGCEQKPAGFWESSNLNMSSSDIHTHDWAWWRFVSSAEQRGKLSGITSPSSDNRKHLFLESSLSFLLAIRKEFSWIIKQVSCMKTRFFPQGGAGVWKHEPESLILQLH